MTMAASDKASETARADMLRTLPFRPAAVEMEQRADGAVLLRSPYAPGKAPRSIVHLLAERAQAHPDRPFLLRRGPDGQWRGVTYAEAVEQARAIGQWLLDQGADAGHGVLILSGNSIAHALVMLGAGFAGVPATPLSEGHSLVSRDHATLRHCAARVTPRIVFAEDGARFADALASVADAVPGAETLCVDNAPGTCFADAARTRPGPALEKAFDGVGPDTVAKYLFTSGSTGVPKAVPQTQRMMTAMIAAREGLLNDPEEYFPRITLDWMPWSHLSAGNIGFNHNIWAGGTFHIDEGRPVPGRFETTLHGFVELSPPVFASAPVAFEMVASALEQRPELRHGFFRNLRWMAYGGAALSRDVHGRIQKLARESVGRRIPILTTYGSTETQGITTLHWETERTGLIGLPLPGVTIKLAPVGDKMEVRVRGDVVSRGYHGDAAANATAFDEEGFYCLGDAALLADPDAPEEGLAFDGRISEDFKLSTGTWVSVGTLRPELIAACSPIVRDIVIVGQDRPFLCAMLWPGAGYGADAATADAVAEMLVRFNATAGGSSRQVRRFLLLAEPPSLEAGEITDKGYVNQRRVLSRRAALADSLYADPLAPGVTEIR